MAAGTAILQNTFVPAAFLRKEDASKMQQNKMQRNRKREFCEEKENREKPFLV